CPVELFRVDRCEAGREGRLVEVRRALRVDAILREANLRGGPSLVAERRLFNEADRALPITKIIMAEPIAGAAPRHEARRRARLDIQHPRHPALEALVRSLGIRPRRCS